MPTPAPTFQDLYDIGQGAATTVRPDLTVEENTIVDMLLAGAAAMGDHVAGYTAQRFKATFVDGAEGDDLTTLADDHWQISRVEAQPARGVLQISRPVNASAPAETFDAGRVVATARDATGAEVLVTLDAPVSFVFGESGTKSVNATCTATGTVGNVAASAFDHFVVKPVDATFTVTNPAAFAGGNPEQDDPALRDEIRSFPNAVRRATLDALEYGAKQVAGIVQATASEDNVSGIVSLYVADANGVASAPLLASVQAALPSWKAAGSIVNVYAGALVVVSVSVTITVRPGVDAAALIASIKAAIVAELERLKIGETLFRGAIERAVRNVSPDGIASVVVNLPLIDTAPLANQSLRTTAGNVLVNGL
jgi:phage-related baseplate assembly protein